MSQQNNSDRELFGELKLPFNHKYIRGEIFPPFLSEEIIERVKEFKLREDDVIISTFPKSGTTWTQKIIQSLHTVHGTGHLQDPNKTLIQQLPWIEETILRPDVDLDSLVSPRYLKTHSPYHMLAYDKAVACRYIYVVRNPKDVCVSLYNHCKSIKGFKYDGDFQEYSELFLEGKVESGDWWKHVKDHYDNSINLDMIFMQYEDMHLDSVTAVKKLNDFCNLPRLTEEKAVQALLLSSFETMKNDSKSNYQWIDRKEGHPPFLRKGTVGDWKNWFSPGMAEKFDQKTQEVFADTSLEFTDTME